MGQDYRVRCCPDGLVTDRRRRIKVLDCTIRDGGLTNNWYFEHELVNRVFQALVEANVDCMEVGYRTTKGHEKFPRDKVGPWRFCDEDDLRRVVEPGRLALSTMVDIGKITTDDIPPKKDTVIDVVRVASSTTASRWATEPSTSSWPSPRSTRTPWIGASVASPVPTCLASTSWTATAHCTRTTSGTSSGST